MGERKYALGDLLRPLRELPIIMDGEMCTGRPTAPVMTRYRCFLPDLAGLAGLRRVGPGTGTSLPPCDVICYRRQSSRSNNGEGFSERKKSRRIRSEAWCLFSSATLVWTWSSPRLTPLGETMNRRNFLA